MDSIGCLSLNIKNNFLRQAVPAFILIILFFQVFL